MAAATKNVAASTKKGSANATSNSSEPRGGPTKRFMMPSMLHTRPFAFSSWSGRTMLGIRVWLALSRSTSAMPRSSVAVRTIRKSPVRVPVTVSSSSGAGSEPCARSTATATNRVRNPRSTSIVTIALRRSTRSVMTPAGRVNSSQGMRCATATVATRIGLRVTAEASQG
jgi:hypothetical protein